MHKQNSRTLRVKKEEERKEAKRKGKKEGIKKNKRKEREKKGRIPGNLPPGLPPPKSEHWQSMHSGVDIGLDGHQADLRVTTCSSEIVVIFSLLSEEWGNRGMKRISTSPKAPEGGHRSAGIKARTLAPSLSFPCPAPSSPAPYPTCQHQDQPPSALQPAASHQPGTG